MVEPQYQVLLYYKYVQVDNPNKLRDEQRALCNRLNLKGRIIIAQEGINGTLEGTKQATKEYIRSMIQDSRFVDVNFKQSTGTGSVFPKLRVRVREEIVELDLGEDDFSPEAVAGKYLTAEGLHEWFESGKEFYIVDMRNDYEFNVGHFQNSIFPGLTQFRDLPRVLPKLESLKDKTVVTVCTGGVRCEKASGFLVKNGFLDVYQLQDGIVTYMEKYPGEHFKGSLYVFDNRLVMGFNLADPNREIIGKCFHCGKPSENYVNCAYDFCHYHYICCQNCLNKDGLAFDKKDCQKIYDDPTKFLSK